MNITSRSLFQVVLLCLLGVVVFSFATKRFKKTPPKSQLGHHEEIPYLPRKNYDTARLFNGIFVKSSVECSQSELNTLATIKDTNSYQLDIKLHVAWPKAAVTTADLAAATPELPILLPNLDTLLQGASASPDFAELLGHKEKWLKTNLSVLQHLPYRDSLFDCQTILNLKNTNSSRTALLVQALMNVNTDGSDGDRNLNIEKLSTFFQPQTNYRWAKISKRPNPCLRDPESHLALVEAELGNGTLTPSDKIRLESERNVSKEIITELKRWSFLVGGADPFIVLPSFMVGKSATQPAIGDYAVVLAHGTLYPAILGDLGPNHKIGEASLRICKEINSKSEADVRPTSRPEVVYFVFPGSAEKPLTAPNYQHWSERCHALWKEFGGSPTAPWHEWTSLEKPWPTPTPSPTPPSSSITPISETNTPSSSLTNGMPMPSTTTP